MRTPTLIHLSLLPALLFGCGSSPKGTNPNPPYPPASAVTVTGRISFSASPAAVLSLSAPTPAPVASFTGNLQSSGSRVTGTLRALTNTPVTACISPLTDLPAVGTLDSSGSLTLTVPIAGGTAVITSAVPDAAHPITPGAWQITGGSCATADTPVRTTHPASL